MKSMLVSDLNKEDFQDLLKKVSELKHELMNLRFQKSSSQLEKTAVIRIVRRNIARVKTVLTQKKLDIKREK